MTQIEIPEGWEEIHREMAGWAHKEKWGTVNIRFPHPRLEFSECIVEFLPTFLPPKTKVGIILIALHKEEDFEEFIMRETEAAMEGGIIDENTGLPFELEGSDGTGKEEEE